MIYFSDLITSTLKDIKNQNSMMIYNKKCSLNCIGCFHKNDEHFSFGKFKNEEYILSYISEYGELFENIILSGGTFLEENFLDIMNFITRVRRIFNGKIYLYDNGFNYNKLSSIVPFIDGVFLDIKLPIYSISLCERFYEQIIGNSFDGNKVVSLIDSIKLLYSIKDEKHIVFRTVKYKIYNDKILSDLNDFINLFFSDIKYEQNDFIEPEKIVVSED